MRRSLRWSRLIPVGATCLALFCAACLALGGCSGCVRIPATKKTETKKDDAIAYAQALYHKATEAAGFRDANEQVNHHLGTEANVLAKYQPAAADRKSLQAILAKHGVSDAGADERALHAKFLESVVGLDKGEIDETESGTFRLLDAHYLEGCFLLRGAALAMGLPEKMKPLDKADFCFRWVMRQVLLHQSRDELLAPQFVLRRGSGSASERAFVFLSLIKQLNLDGCILPFPGDGPLRTWLVGVLIEGQGAGDVYLFDPRLGLPVPGPKGQGIATLAQLRHEPKLLDGFKVPDDACQYDVDPKQAAAAEINVLMPLSALSARMRYLEEEVLFHSDRINLAVRPLQLIEKFEALKAGPVHVWNTRPTKGRPAAVSPTLALRHFLPPEEGGVDTTKRLARFKNQLVPMPSMFQGFAEEKLAPADLPIQDALARLTGMAEQLWLNYADTPHQQLVRGRLDECTKRLVHMQDILDSLSNESEQEWDKKVAKWRERVKAAFIKGDLAKIWGEDEWLMQLLTAPDEEIANANKLQRKLLSYVVLRAVSKPLRNEADYLLALRWQEKAERLQAKLRQLAASGAVPDKVRNDTRAAWDVTLESWAKYGLGDLLTPTALQEQAEAVKKLAASNKEFAVALLDNQVALFRQTASARLLEAQGLTQLNKTKAATGVLQKLVADLHALAQNEDLKNLRGTLATPELRSQVDKIYADLEPRGSLFWIRYTATWQLQRSKG